MPSSYTPRLRLEKMAAGENLNTWGDPKLNTVISRVDFGLAGWTVKELTSDATLSTSNTLEDEARAAVLKFTGDGSFTVTLPPVEKVYTVWNACSGGLVLSTGAGETVSLSPSEIALVICDGTQVKALGFDSKTVKAYVDSVAFSSASGEFPAQSGNAGRFIGTDGANASWVQIEQAHVTNLTSDLDSLRGGNEPLQVLPISGGVLTLDLGQAVRDFKVHLDSDITSLVYLNPPPPGTMKSWTLRFVADGAVRGISWPTEVKHNGGAAPAVASGAGKTTTFVQFTDDGGVKIHTFKSGETG